MQTLFKKKPEFQQVDPYKISYNLGCLMDIPAGEYVKGMKGENIMNGGLSLFTAIAGRGNTFKSTIEHYMTLSAANTVAMSGIEPYINTYDTEMNISVERLMKFGRRFEAFKDIDMTDAGIWNITDKTKHQGNEWFKLLKDFLKNEKIKNAKQYTFATPMVDKKGDPIMTMFPTFGQVDSISEFTTDATDEIQDKNELGESGGNTIHMRSGLDKTRLLMEIPTICNAGSHYIIMTAHVGKEIPMNQGPYSIPPKTLQHMRQGEKIKGVADKFFFLPTSLWQTMSSSMLNNQTTKGPEFPKYQKDTEEDSTDLNVVTLKQLRSKSGMSGYSIDVVVSQREGVLATLSEFLFLKENERFGFEGNNTSYNMVLLPSVKLMRTTLRENIDNNPKLRRAIKILADMKQISIYQKHLPQITDLSDFYNKLEKKYGWDKLLETRDYWTFNQYENKVPFLSTLDLIEMYHDRYTPYWM